MERRKLLALIIIITVVSVSVVSTVLYTDFFGSKRGHDPITITSDEEFTKENGITGGSGTREDPYIIEGWTIDSSGIEYGPEAAGIVVKETSAYLIIRNVSISGPNVHGILFRDVVNCRIENSTVTYHAFGITVLDCHRCTIVMNHISSCMIGMEIGNLSDVAISDNEILDGTKIDSDSKAMLVGIRFTELECENVTISRNEFGTTGFDLNYCEMPPLETALGLSITPDNTVNGRPVYFLDNQTEFSLRDIQVGQVILLNCNFARLSGLEVSDASTCISLIGVNDSSISDCSVSNGDYAGGIIAKESSNITIYSNSVSNATISLARCSNVVFHNNQILSSCAGATGLEIIECDNVTIQSNLIRECSPGMRLRGENVTVTGNILLSNRLGIMSENIYNLKVFCNDFIDNNQSVTITTGLKPMLFHNETSRMGNYWSDYDGLDENGDGIGDSPYVIALNVQDDYPLMAPVNS